MKDVKIVLARRFEAALEAIKKVDADRDAYLMADVRDLIPEPPKPLELRGPSWSAIAEPRTPSTPRSNVSKIAMSRASFDCGVPRAEGVRDVSPSVRERLLNMGLPGDGIQQS